MKMKCYITMAVLGLAATAMNAQGLLSAANQGGITGWTLEVSAFSDGWGAISVGIPTDGTSTAAVAPFVTDNGSSFTTDFTSSTLPGVWNMWSYHKLIVPVSVPTSAGNVLSFSGTLSASGDSLNKYLLVKADGQEIGLGIPSTGVTDPVSNLPFSLDITLTGDIQSQNVEFWIAAQEPDAGSVDGQAGGLFTVDGLSLTVVPEPSHFALIFGLGALAFLAIRRRRS
jgi:hypothetical protein